MGKGLVVVVVVLIMCFAGTAWAYDNDDFQTRFAPLCSLTLNDEWGATIYEEFNFGDDSGELYAQANELSFTYSAMADWLDVSVAYCQLFAKNGNAWNQTNIPWLAGKLKWELLDMNMSNQSRFDYNRREQSDNGWIYKNCTVADLPFKLTSLEMQPYIYDEVCYDLDKGQLTWNESRFGVSFDMTEKIGLNLYYLLGHSYVGDDKWSRSHMAALSLSASF